MENTKHTPTPYFLSERDTAKNKIMGDYHFAKSIKTNDAGASITVWGTYQKEVEARAAFIVKACNSYEQHVKALETIIWKTGGMGMGKQEKLDQIEGIAKKALKESAEPIAPTKGNSKEIAELYREQAKIVMEAVELQKLNAELVEALKKIEAESYNTKNSDGYSLHLIGEIAEMAIKNAEQ